VEDRDHDVPDLPLRHQGHTQEGTYHTWDEVDLVLTWRGQEEESDCTSIQSKVYICGLTRMLCV
jgi:hypothetical protein